MSALLEARSISYGVSGRGQVFLRRKPVRSILRDIDLELDAAETLGVIGASGSGKSTLGRILGGLIVPDRGHILFREKNFTSASARDRKAIRPHIQMIFQDPRSALDPRQKVGDILREPLHLLHLSAAQKDERIRSTLSDVALPPDCADRYPQAFSGGQRQRIAIARALVTRPSVIIADEITAALDMATQATILNLLLTLQETHKLSYVFISHDLSVIRHVSHRVAVLDEGMIVETGRTHDVLRQPAHATTRAFVDASL